MRTLPALLLMLVFLPAVALADGMVVYHTEVGVADTIAVEAEAQRAVLWFRDGTWELTIQPRFPRGAGAAAWLVPLPGIPEVSEASPDFLDALETLTAPVFIPYCNELESSGGTFGCAGASSSGGGGAGRAGSGEQLVTVWARGTTDELEWVVLEASGADALVAWLNDEGYRVPGILADKPEILEGQIMFAAKLKDGLDPGVPLPPMTFHLPGVDYEDVTYPLRLTAAVAPEEGMELLLWVVTPSGSQWLDSPVPANVHWLPHDVGNTTRAQWEADAETLRAAFPPEGGLVLEFNDICNEFFYGYPLTPPGGSEPVMPQDVGIELPEAWPDEVSEIVEDHYSVRRFRGRLTAAAMDEDLAFEFVPGTEVPSIKSIHWNEVPCSQIDDVSEITAARSPLRGWIGTAMLGLVALLSLAFMRRTR